MKNRRSFIIGLSSHYLSTNEKKFLKKYKPWGVILFSRNIGSINQTKKLTNEIRKIFNDNKYPILVDQEGGRVNRLKNIICFDNLTSEYFGNKYIKGEDTAQYLEGMKLQAPKRSAVVVKPAKFISWDHTKI